MGNDNRTNSGIIGALQTTIIARIFISLHVTDNRRFLHLFTSLTEWKEAPDHVDRFASTTHSSNLGNVNSVDAAHERPPYNIDILSYSFILLFTIKTGKNPRKLNFHV